MVLLLVTLKVHLMVPLMAPLKVPQLVLPDYLYLLVLLLKVLQVILLRY